MDDQLSPPPIKIIIECPPTHPNHQHNQKPKTFILPNLQACHFSITLSISAQALLWKTLVDHHTISQTQRPLQRVAPTLPYTTFLLLWYLTLATQLSLSLLYFLKFVFHPKMVKSEFSHIIGLNYFFAPSISWLIWLVSSPFFASKTTSYQILCWVFAIPLLILDVKVYGQWFMSEKRFLSVFANPTSQVSVIGNFIVAWAAAEMGWREFAICVFTLGAVHYLVLFVTLYQRLSGSCRVPARLRPVFFLFVAAPSVGSLAWKSISGTFDVVSKMLFFLALFLFISLVIFGMQKFYICAQIWIRVGPTKRSS